MIFSITQQNKELFGAQFVIHRDDQQLGTILVKGRMGQRLAAVSGTFSGEEFELRPGRNKMILSRPMDPFCIKLNETEEGAVYQTKSKGKIFQRFDYHHVVKNGKLYEVYPIAFGEEAKIPVYDGETQIAQIEKSFTVYNDLHNYQIFALDDNAAITAVFATIYMYVCTKYKAGQKAVSSVTKGYSLTKDERILSKYNPDFAKSITK